MNKKILLVFLLSLVFTLGINIKANALCILDDEYYRYVSDNYGDIENSKYLLRFYSKEYEVTSDDDKTFTIDNENTSSKLQMIPLKNNYDYHTFDANKIDEVRKFANEYNVFFNVRDEYCTTYDASINDEKLLWFSASNDDYAILLMPYKDMLYVIKTFYKGIVVDKYESLNSIFYSLFTVSNSIVLDDELRDIYNDDFKRAINNTDREELHKYYYNDVPSVATITYDDNAFGDIAEEISLHEYYDKFVNKLDEYDLPHLCDDRSDNANMYFMLIASLIYILLCLVFLKLLLPKSFYHLRKFTSGLFGFLYFIVIAFFYTLVARSVSGSIAFTAVIVYAIAQAASVPRKTKEELEIKKQEKIAQKIIIDNGIEKRVIDKARFEAANDDPIVKGKKFGSNDDDPFIK